MALLDDVGRQVGRGRRWKDVEDGGSSDAFTDLHFQASRKTVQHGKMVVKCSQQAELKHAKASQHIKTVDQT